jgi:hypothetical protein
MGRKTQRYIANYGQASLTDSLAPGEPAIDAKSDGLHWSCEAAERASGPARRDFGASSDVCPSPGWCGEHGWCLRGERRRRALERARRDVDALRIKRAPGSRSRGSGSQ